MKGASRKTAFILFFVRFIKLLVSVITLSVSAKLFGVGMDRERWILCLNFVTVLNLAIWGPLNETFRAKFIFVREAEGEARALERTGSLLLFTLLVLCGVIVLLEVFSIPVSKVIAPAYNADSLLKLSQMMRWLLVSAVITQAGQLLGSILNTYGSFYVPEITGFFSGILNLVLILLLSRYIGIYSFVVANYISLFILLLALMYQVRKLDIHLFKGPVNISWSQVKPFILFSVPFFIPYIIGQCNGLIEKSISNVLGHSTVAIIDYSKKITDIVQTVLTSVLATIMVPVLSAAFSRGQMETVAAEARKYLQLIFLILAFLVPVLVVSSDHIAVILYDKGNISQPDLHSIAVLIRYYSLGLLPVFLYLAFGLILLSVNKTRQYAFYGMITQVLIIAVSLLGYRQLGIYTFVCALIFAHLLTSCVLFFRLPFARRETGIDMLKYFSLILLVLLTVIAINKYVYSPFGHYTGVLCIAAEVFLSGALFSALLQMGEIRLLIQYIKKIKEK